VHRSKSGPLMFGWGPLASNRLARDVGGMSALLRYCCKSPKLLGDDFPSVSRTDLRPPIFVDSITLPRSPVSLSSGAEVPHIFTRKSRLQPKEFLITSAKRLLQHNPPKATICNQQQICRFVPLAAVSRCSELSYETG